FEIRFLTKTSLQWRDRLDDAGVPNEISFDAMGGQGALYDADAERLGLVGDYEHPIMGNLRQFGELVNFSDTPARVFGPPPRAGPRRHGGGRCGQVRGARRAAHGAATGRAVRGTGGGSRPVPDLPDGHDASHPGHRARPRVGVVWAIARAIGRAIAQTDWGR